MPVTRSDAFRELAGVKEDNRPVRGGWAPGKYHRCCRSCGSRFIGDKRAITCADCAYGEDSMPVTRSDAFSDIGKPMSEEDAAIAKAAAGVANMEAIRKEADQAHEAIAQAQAQQQPVKVGDVVALRSGGPSMTVMSLEGDYASVAWFDERDCMHQQTVGIAGLRRRLS